MDLINKSKVDQPMVPFEVGEIPQVRVLEFEELEDLLQMIVSNTNQDLQVYHLERNEEHLYFNWMILHDFYALNGLPIVVVARSDKAPARFIRFRPDLGRIDFVDKVDESSAAYIKVLKIRQLPFCLDLTL